MRHVRLKRSLRATLLGLGVNALLAGAKLVAGILGHSYALVADAVESMADIFSSLIVWRGLVVAAVPADADHPYGHGKAEPIATAAVAGLLLAAAFGITIEAVRKIFSPAGSPEPFTLFVLVTVILVKEGLFRFVFRESRAVESSAVEADAWHHRSDAITSLMAAIGITISLVGGPRYAAADSVAAIAAAGVIAWNGIRFLRKAISELMDTAPSGSFTAELIRIASETEGVDHVEKCFVRKMGYDHFVDMHVQVDPAMTVQRAHQIAHLVKDRIREKQPSVADVLVHIEPSRREDEGQTN